jgi:cytochrome c oxidase subunit 4
MGMSQIHATTAHLEEPEEHAHPTEAKYIQIAIILSIITIVEVGLFYLESFEGVLVPALILLSAIKFVMVVGYFMHLKFDDKRLAWIFSAGMGVALAIYIGTWALMYYDQVTEYVSNMF